jgi:hypothetical protein
MSMWERARIVSIATAMVPGALSRAIAGCGAAGTSVAGAPVAHAGHHEPGQVAALRLTQAPTPRFRVDKYDTEGTYAQVQGPGDLRRVNAALRRIVTSDQAAYTKFARRAAREAGSHARGAYSTYVDAKTTSASTAVVSVLMRAIHLSPGGSHGGEVLSGTVQVPSGQRVGITQPFRDSARALPVLAREFKRAYRAQHPSLAGCLENVSLKPVPSTFRHFALLPHGLAVGFGDYGCTWIIATVPYSPLRPYFNHLGRVLSHAVRRPAVP